MNPHQFRNHLGRLRYRASCGVRRIIVKWIARRHNGHLGVRPKTRRSGVKPSYCCDWEFNGNTFNAAHSLQHTGSICLSSLSWVRCVPSPFPLSSCTGRSPLAHRLRLGLLVPLRYSPQILPPMSPQKPAHVRWAASSFSIVGMRVCQPRKSPDELLLDGMFILANGSGGPEGLTCIGYDSHRIQSMR